MRNKQDIELWKKADQHTEQTRVTCIKHKVKCNAKTPKVLNTGTMRKEFLKSGNKTVV